MAKKFDHTVLIVDDEAQVGKALGRLMKAIGVKYVYMESGQAALDYIKGVSKPFSRTMRRNKILKNIKPLSKIRSNWRFDN